MQACESYERAACTRNPQSHTPRATQFGDIITADHKVFNEEEETRNNQRCAIVVQGLATQWIQSYPCKTTTSQGTVRNLRKVLDLEGNPKVRNTDNSLEFGKACEDLRENHSTSTLYWLEANRIAERAVGRLKEGTSSILLQSELDKQWQHLWNATATYEMSKISHQMGKLHTKGVLKHNSVVLNHTNRSKHRITSDASNRSGEAPSSGQERILTHFYGLRSARGRKLERRLTRGRR